MLNIDLFFITCLEFETIIISQNHDPSSTALTYNFGTNK